MKSRKRFSNGLESFHHVVLRTRIRPKRPRPCRIDGAIAYWPMRQCEGLRFSSGRTLDVNNFLFDDFLLGSGPARWHYGIIKF